MRVVSARQWRASIAALLATLLATESVAASISEANVWKERRQGFAAARSSVALAGLPAEPSRRISTALPAPAFLSIGADVRRPTLRIASLSPRASLSDAVVSLPWSLGRISERNAVGGSKTVVHIQDIHLNPEAQKNIRDAVTALLPWTGAVAIEGEWGPLRLDGFRAYPRHGMLVRAANAIFASGDLDGPLYALLTSSRTVPLFGADDRAHYAANVAAYRKAARLKARAVAQINEEGRALAAEKARLYSSDLRSLDDAVEAYHRGDLPLGNYLLRLRTVVEPASSVVDDFLKTFRLERSIDLDRTATERRLLIQELAHRLNSAALQDLIAHSLAYKSGDESAAEFYGHLQALCGGCGADLRRYPAMSTYLAYVLAADRIDPSALQAAVIDMERRAVRSLIRTPAQAALAEASRRHRLTGQLLQFSLSPEEWSEYKKLAQRTPDVLEPFKDFYREAEARDATMTARVVDLLDKKNLSSVVLVTGGFHAAGVLEGLEKRGIRVIEWTPRVTHVDQKNGSRALEIFTQEKSPLESIFDGRKLFLAPRPSRGLPRLAAALIVLAMALPAAARLPPLLEYNRLLPGAGATGVVLKPISVAESMVTVTSAGGSAEADVRDLGTAGLDITESRPALDAVQAAAKARAGWLRTAANWQRAVDFSGLTHRAARWLLGERYTPRRAELWVAPWFELITLQSLLPLIFPILLHDNRNADGTVNWNALIKRNVGHLIMLAALALPFAFGTDALFWTKLAIGLALHMAAHFGHNKLFPDAALTTGPSAGGATVDLQFASSTDFDSLINAVAAAALARIPSEMRSRLGASPIARLAEIARADVASRAQLPAVELAARRERLREGPPNEDARAQRKEEKEWEPYVLAVRMALTFGIFPEDRDIAERLRATWSARRLRAGFVETIGEVRRDATALDRIADESVQGDLIDRLQRLWTESNRWPPVSPVDEATLDVLAARVRARLPATVRDRLARFPVQDVVASALQNMLGALIAPNRPDDDLMLARFADARALHDVRDLAERYLFQLLAPYPEPLTHEERLAVVDAALRQMAEEGIPEAELPATITTESGVVVRPFSTGNSERAIEKGAARALAEPQTLGTFFRSMQIDPPAGTDAVGALAALVRSAALYPREQAVVARALADYDVEAAGVDDQIAYVVRTRGLPATPDRDFAAIARTIVSRPPVFRRLLQMILADRGNADLRELFALAGGPVALLRSDWNDSPEFRRLVREIRANPANAELRDLFALTGAPASLLEPDWTERPTFDPGVEWHGGFSIHDRRIVMRNEEGGIDIRDVQTGTLLHRLPGPEGGHFDLFPSVDGGRILMTAGNGAATFWDSETGQRIPSAISELFLPIFSLAFSSDGRRIAIGMHTGWLQIHDLVTREERTLRTGQSGQIVRFSPDGRRLVSTFQNRIEVFDVATGELLRTLTGARSRIYSLDFSPDGRLLATGDADGRMAVWDVVNGVRLQSEIGHEGRVRFLRFSPDGRWVLTGSWDGTAGLWNVATGQVMHTFTHDGTTAGVSFAPDGRTAFTAYEDPNVHVRAWTMPVAFWPGESGPVAPTAVLDSTKRVGKDKGLSDENIALKLAPRRELPYTLIDFALLVVVGVLTLGLVRTNFFLNLHSEEELRAQRARGVRQIRWASTVALALSVLATVALTLAFGSLISPAVGPWIYLVVGVTLAVPAIAYAQVQAHRRWNRIALKMKGRPTLVTRAEEAAAIATAQSDVLQRIINNYNASSVWQQLFGGPMVFPEELRPGNFVAPATGDIAEAWWDRANAWYEPLVRRAHLAMSQTPGAHNLDPGVARFQFDLIGRGQRFDGQAALEIGVGAGNTGFALNALGVASIIGIDSNPDMLQIAQRNVPLIANRTATFDLRQDDASRLATIPNATIDLATMFFTGVFVLPGLRARMARRIFEVLRPGGRLVMAEYLPHPFIADGLDMAWTPDQWRQVLEAAGFQVTTETYQAGGNTYQRIVAVRPVTPPQLPAPAAPDAGKAPSAGPAPELPVPAPPATGEPTGGAPTSGPSVATMALRRLPQAIREKLGAADANNEIVKQLIAEAFPEQTRLGLDDFTLAGPQRGFLQRLRILPSGFRPSLRNYFDLFLYQALMAVLNVYLPATVFAILFAVPPAGAADIGLLSTPAFRFVFLIVFSIPFATMSLVLLFHLVMPITSMLSSPASLDLDPGTENELQMSADREWERFRNEVSAKNSDPVLAFALARLVDGVRLETDMYRIRNGGKDLETRKILIPPTAIPRRGGLIDALLNPFRRGYFRYLVTRRANGFYYLAQVETAIRERQLWQGDLGPKDQLTDPEIRDTAEFFWNWFSMYDDLRRSANYGLVGNVAFLPFNLLNLVIMNMRWDRVVGHYSDIGKIRATMRLMNWMKGLMIVRRPTIALANFRLSGRAVRLEDIGQLEIRDTFALSLLADGRVPWILNAETGERVDGPAIKSDATLVTLDPSDADFSRKAALVRSMAGADKPVIVYARGLSERQAQSMGNVAVIDSLTGETIKALERSHGWVIKGLDVRFLSKNPSVLNHDMVAHLGDLEADGYTVTMRMAVFVLNNLVLVPVTKGDLDRMFELERKVRELVEAQA